MWRVGTALLLVVALGAQAAGCSWIRIKPPPENPGMEPVECTESSSAPTSDLIGSVAFGLLTLGSALLFYCGAALSYQPSVGAGGSNGDGCHGCTTMLAIGVVTPVVSLPLAFIFGYSAMDGRDMLERCKKIKRAGEPAEP